MAQVGKAATILVHGFGELFNQAKPDVQRRKEYFVSVHQRIVDDVMDLPGTISSRASQSFLIVLRSVPTIPHA